MPQSESCPALSGFRAEREPSPSVPPERTSSRGPAKLLRSASSVTFGNALERNKNSSWAYDNATPRRAKRADQIGIDR